MELGLGVGVIAPIGFAQERHRAVQLLNAEHLFATSTTRIGVRKGHYLRDFAVDLICRCAPELDANAVRQATA